MRHKDDVEFHKREFEVTKATGIEPYKYKSKPEFEPQIKPVTVQDRDKEVIDKFENQKWERYIDPMEFTS